MISAPPAILVQDVAKTYGRGAGAIRALDGVSFRVERGRIAGLLGPNGAGKSTILHALLGLVRPDRGRLEIFGIPAEDVRAREGVGFLPEEVSYEAGLRVREILGVHERLAGGRRGAGPSEVMRIVGLDIALRRRISRCSQGTARRVALACSLLGAPRLLVLDEPTSAMDVPSRDRLLEHLREFRAAGGTVLISSHVLSELAHVCDSFVIVQAGRVVRTGDLRGARSAPSLRMEIEGIPLASLRSVLGAGWRAREAGEVVIAEAAEAEAGLGSVLEAIEHAGGAVRSVERGRTLEDVYREEVGG